TTTSTSKRRTTPWTGISAVLNRSGLTTTATTKRATDTTTLATLESSPPAATADARSTPRFWRYRICEAAPPTAGMARLAKDIDSCTSVVTPNGSFRGTVPIRPSANVTFVANDRANARRTHVHCASLTVL